jgi:hypothetical protein
MYDLADIEYTLQDKVSSMSYQERKALVNLVSTIGIMVVYAWVMMGRYPAVGDYAPEVFRFWGIFFVILIPVSIVARIVIYIVFSILNTVATREAEPDISDERDKLIELKASRNTGFVLGAGIVLALASQVIALPPSIMFVLLIGAGMVGEMVSDISTFIYYRKGV